MKIRPRYYENSAQIASALNGLPPPTMTPELEERLRVMFMEIQAPFEKHRPKGRNNFLSYSFCIYKMLELLGEDRFLPFFPLLKSREKLLVQDKIWRAITRELNWQYIPVSL